MRDTTAGKQGVDAQGVGPDREFRRAHLILTGLIGFASAGFVQKHAGMGGVAAYLAAIWFGLHATAWLGRSCGGWIRRRFPVLVAVFAIGTAAAHVVLHPLEDGRGPGRSSDRDEGLEMAVERLMEGKNPYYPPNRVAGPLSVLPGAVLLALPFVACGKVGLQNVFWLTMLVLAGVRWYRDRVPALLLPCLLLGASPAVLYEFVSGGDLLANGIYMALGFWWCARTWCAEGSRGWQRWLAGVLLGIGLSSRPNFLLLLPLLGAMLWRTVGLAKGLWATGLAGMVALAVAAPFYLHDPAGFTPLAARHKLALVDHVLPWAGTAMLIASVTAAWVGALVLLAGRCGDPATGFLRMCTWVTLCPMVCAVALHSWVSGRMEFGFLGDRFAVMYLAFAIFGWGGALFRVARSTPSGSAGLPPQAGDGTDCRICES